MRELFQNLNFDFLPLVDMSLQRDARIKRIPEEKINPTLIDLLDQSDLVIGVAESFYTPPYFVQAVAHIDGTPFEVEETWPSRCKLNYTFGEVSTKTRWHDVPTDKKNKLDYRKNSIGYNYNAYAIADCSLIAEEKLSEWHIFEAGIPHSIYNPTNAPRWTISFQLVKKNSPGWMSYLESKELFLPWIK